MDAVVNERASFITEMEENQQTIRKNGNGQLSGYACRKRKRLQGIF